MRTPATYQEPEQRAQRAATHFCKEVGSTVYCDRGECPHCWEGSA